MGVVQVYLDIFRSELELDWATQLERKVPVQFSVVSGEKFHSEGVQKWVNLLKIVQIVFMKDYFQDKLSTNNTLDQTWKVAQYNRDYDRYKFLLVIFNESPEIKNKFPIDYAHLTRMYYTWECTLLRVWI